MNRTMYGVYSPKSRGLPMVLFQSKWHAEGWMERLPDYRTDDYFIKRVQVINEKSAKVFEIKEHLGYKSKPFRRIRSLKEIAS